MTDAWTIRAADVGDHAAVGALNAANVPEVGVLDGDRLALFAARAEAFWVAEDVGEVVGLFVGLFDSHEYASRNYRWFSDRHDRFAYVDRIALAPSARGRGIADALYDRWEALAVEHGVPLACAEVNTVPANPRSLAFHERRGFVRVAEEAPYGGDERVAMLERQLT